MSELKPCPFCGGEAKTVLADTYPHRGMLHSWFVACTDSECGCELGFYGMDENGTCGTYETEAEAIEAWNTRAERTCRMTDRGECSECGAYIVRAWTEVHDFNGDMKRIDLRSHNYCPNCGAKVVE